MFLEQGQEVHPQTQKSLLTKSKFLTWLASQGPICSKYVPNFREFFDSDSQNSIFVVLNILSKEWTLKFLLQIHDETDRLHILTKLKEFSEIISDDKESSSLEAGLRQECFAFQMMFFDWATVFDCETSKKAAQAVLKDVYKSIGAKHSQNLEIIRGQRMLVQFSKD